jgi:16S rRNA (guanine1207-N2)-methyltransferase
MQLGLLRVYLRGLYLEFLTAPSIFSKKKIDAGTKLLAECMCLPKSGFVLDLGCGYGPVGIVAAISNPRLHVIMTDVNERAVLLARQNVKRNNVHNAEVRYGFLYEPVGDMKFQTILSNPPLTAGLKNVVIPLICQSKDHLTNDGYLQLVVRTGSGGKRIGQIMKETFGNAEVIDRQSGYRVFISTISS